MNGTQCDSCRKFAAGAAPAGWLLLARLPDPEPAAEPSSFLEVLGGRGGGPEVSGTFCSPKCLAEHALLLEATQSAGSGP